jgi:hypothetical protein
MGPLTFLSLFLLPILSHAQLPTLPTGIIIDTPLLPVIRDRFTAETAIAAKAAALGPFIGRAKGSLTFVSAPSTPATGGYFQEFDSGTIYTERASTAAWAVNGAILARYLALGGPKSPLGFPTSDWTGCPDGRGWFNTFGSGGGAIYWTPQTGANEVYGNPMAQWTAMGRERGWLGYPETGVQRGAEGSETEAVVAFEGGVVTFNTRRDGRNGTVAWQDLFWGEYRRLGGPTGVLGLPVDRGMRAWFVQVDGGGRGVMRMDFRGGYVRVPLDWPRAQGVQTGRVRVKFAGLECVARQETEDEMSGAIGLLVPAMKRASWVFKISDWRFKDHVRVWPVTAGNILYEGPPAEIKVFSELVEVDNSEEDVVANTCVNGLAGDGGLAGALNWLGEGQGENEVLKAYNREEGFWNGRWSVGTSIEKDWFPGDNPYPEGRMMVKLPDFQRSKQRVFRSDDSRIITYTHFIRMEGVDNGGDHGIYHVYFDLDYFPMNVML